MIYLGGIIYVGLDAFPEYELVAAGGNFMFADLTSVAGCLYRFSAVADCRARWRPGVSRSCNTVAGRVNVSVIFRMVCALAICSGVSLPWSRWRSSRAASRAGLSCGMHRQDWQARGGQH